MKQPNYRRTKLACYYTNVVMASAFSLPPMLFGAFRSTYGISYTLLGTLVLVNFCTQLTVDLILTFLGRRFNLKKLVRGMPLLTAVGLLIYAVAPALLPQYAYVGLLCGTVVFSVAAGCCEVLMSPVIAALPSDDPGRDMSRLHSLYGYGVLLVVAISTVFFSLFGTANWLYLTVLFAVLPVAGWAMLCASPIPEIDLGGQETSGRNAAFRGAITFCAVCIFFGGIAECTMTNWVSVFLEKGLALPKATSDMLGLAAFSALLALTRTAYAKYGRNISKVLRWSMAGATCCYVVAGLSALPVLSVAACMLTGVCTAMLWPGTLILMEEKAPHPGVAAYALMAACGDLGGAVGPQLLGAAVDVVSVTEWAERMSGVLALSAEQIGMKAAVLLVALFPLAGLILLCAGKTARSGR